jgi:uncharacterized protein YfaS (alpha-2-macroglobulin family)
MANVVFAFDRAGQRSAPAVAPLATELERGVVVRLHQGRETYGGLRSEVGPPSGLLLPSEARTLAEMIRALAAVRTEGGSGKLDLMTSALVARAEISTGWGSTNANSAAMLALAERIERGGSSAPAEVLVKGAHKGEGRLTVGGAGAAAAAWIDTAGGEATVSVISSAVPVGARASLTFLPAAPGSEAAARTAGFVVTRELLVHRAAAPSGSPPERWPLAKAGALPALAVGDVVEEHVQVVNSDDRHFVAVTVPLAGGMEPLNPNLETAPPEATPAGSLSLDPTYSAYLDDRVAFYYNELPRGTYDFFFRTRAQVEGDFVQPPAKAEMMYDLAVAGASPGAKVVVRPGAD